ncbi:hypothetical protein PG996_010737 [Apiospora saccharicola]|uniref:Uncharacterized protein n=1 Tax=Apiospora saccharicola TaxID=335842 RepID=A0ABR1UPF9_9PEZI
MDSRRDMSQPSNPQWGHQGEVPVTPQRKEATMSSWGELQAMISENASCSSLQTYQRTESAASLRTGAASISPLSSGLRHPLSSSARSPGSQAALLSKQQDQDQELRRLCRIFSWEDYKEHVGTLLEKEKRANRALKMLRLALLKPSEEWLLQLERENNLKLQEQREVLLGLWSDARSERALRILREALLGPL